MVIKIKVKNYKMTQKNKKIKIKNYYFSYLLEVDLDYPEEIHNFHNDYPLAPERLKTNKTEIITNNLKNKKVCLTI